jgi:AraC-like DNA-binding protein
MGRPASSARPARVLGARVEGTLAGVNRVEFLPSHRVFQTRSAAEGQRFASEVWERHRSRLKGKDFALTWNQANLRRASLAYVDHPCGVVARCDGPISDTFRILFHQSGRIDHRINGKESISLPGRCTIHPPRADLKLDIESFSLLLLSLDGDFVRSALNQRFSKLPPFEEWATSFSLESPSIATLNSLCLWLAKELENPQSPLITQDRVAANFERTLLTLFVEGLVERHPETASVRGNLSDVHVSQAEEWIDAHLAEPIGLEEVAAGMGVDAQALVRTFKRLRGQSPLRAILRRRLERARNALQSAEPGATVTEIATGLGFFELGRFAVRYREQFGERPSETLARRLVGVSEPSRTMQEMHVAPAASA